jgi:polyisoprenoid-binding protein YceI
MSTTLQDVPTGTYTLDPVHSTFGFVIGHNGVAKFRGEFEQVDAKLENGVLTGTAQVESVMTRVPQLTEHLVSPEFFDASDTPTIQFRSTTIRITDGATAEVGGELTIRGVTKPVTATGSVVAGQSSAGDELVGVDLQTTIDRRDYGLNWQAQLPNGDDALAWDVTIEAHLELAKA